MPIISPWTFYLINLIDGVSIISLIMIIIIPSKETCYQMLAAKMVTYENVGLAVRKIEEIALFLMNGTK